MKSLTKKLAAVGAAAGLVVGGASLAGAGHLNELLETELDGRNEVASDAKSNKIVGDPDGRGEGYVFGIDGDPTTLCYIVIAEKIAELDLAPGNGRAAHIHEGQPGENGPVVANLAWPQDGQSADCLTEGEAGKFPTGEPGIVQEILQNPGDYYFNVHNTEYPGGALRGQLEVQGHHHG